MADRAEGRFNQITGFYALPVLRREVIKCHQLVPVLLQAEGCLRILRLIGLYKQIERLFRIGLGLCLPDFVQRLFRFRLSRLRQAIELVHGLVHPVALLTRLRIDFLHSAAQKPIAVDAVSPDKTPTVLIQTSVALAPAPLRPDPPEHLQGSAHLAAGDALQVQPAPLPATTQTPDSVITHTKLEPHSVVVGNTFLGPN